MIELKFKMKLEMYGNLVDYNSLYYLMDTSVNLGYPEVETVRLQDGTGFAAEVEWTF